MSNYNSYGSSGERESSLQPLAPPPAAPPPPPPPPTPDEGQPLIFSHDNNKAEAPVITHHYCTGGDTTLNPNTGESNAFSEEVVGLALSEILFHLQWSCVVSCFFLLVYEILCVFVWPIEIVMGKWVTLVLSGYIMFFALVLFLLEVFFTASMLYSQQILPELWIYRLIDNFGFLFHPLKKAFFMLFLTLQVLFTNQRNIIEYLFGLWWIGNSIATMYVWYKYPDFRKHTHLLRVAARTRMMNRTASFKEAAWKTWSYYQTLSWGNNQNNNNSSMTTNV